MTLSHSMILLALSILLPLQAMSANVEDERATEAELARLSSNQLEMQAQLEIHLDAQIESWVKATLDPVLTERIVQQLRNPNRVAYRRRSDMPPAAILAVTDDLPEAATEQSYATRCRMVGHTFECVLQDIPTP